MPEEPEVPTFDFMPLFGASEQVVSLATNGLLQLQRGLKAAHVELELLEPPESDVDLIRQFVCGAGSDARP